MTRPRWPPGASGGGRRTAGSSWPRPSAASRRAATPARRFGKSPRTPASAWRCVSALPGQGGAVCGRAGRAVARIPRRDTRRAGAADVRAAPRRLHARLERVRPRAAGVPGNRGGRAGDDRGRARPQGRPAAGTPAAGAAPPGGPADEERGGRRRASVRGCGVPCVGVPRPRHPMPDGRAGRSAHVPPADDVVSLFCSGAAAGRRARRGTSS